MSQVENIHTTTSIMTLADELAQAMALNAQLDERCVAIRDKRSPEYAAAKAAFEANERRMTELDSRIVGLRALTPSEAMVQVALAYSSTACAKRLECPSDSDRCLWSVLRYLEGLGGSMPREFGEHYMPASFAPRWSQLPAEGAA